MYSRQSTRKSDDPSIVDYSWSSPRSTKGFYWPPFVRLRGSIRLFSGRVVGEDEVDAAWFRMIKKLKKML